MGMSVLVSLCLKTSPWKHINVGNVIVMFKDGMYMTFIIVF